MSEPPAPPDLGEELEPAAHARDGLRAARIAGGSWANADADGIRLRPTELRDTRLTGVGAAAGIELLPDDET